MIRNKTKLEEFERELLRSEALTYKQALEIFEGLRKEAVSLGALTSENILDGIEVDIRIAKAVNGLR